LKAEWTELMQKNKDIQPQAENKNNIENAIWINRDLLISIPDFLQRIRGRRTAMPGPS
jgi:hypothetical protein